MLALDFPPISHLIVWRDLFGTSGPFGINKVVLLMWLAAILVFLAMWSAGRRAQHSEVPTGIQNVVESMLDFIREGIILQTIGPEGLAWLPFLATLFAFIFLCNIFEVIPLIQMPVNARMALPLFMALVVWVIYNYVGIRSQGFGGYLKSALVPPGVPKAMLPLVSLIELIQLLIARPFSLAVRLFANMLAGHLILVTFAVLSTALFNATYIGSAVPLALLIALTGFEVLVSVLQAFIFTILTAVYIGGALHPEH